MWYLFSCNSNAAFFSRTNWIISLGVTFASAFIFANKPERLMPNFSARKSTDKSGLSKLFSISWFILVRNSSSAWLPAIVLMGTTGICENFCCICENFCCNWLRKSIRFFTQASRYCMENGFSIYASAPQFMPAIFEALSVFAVSRIKGMWLVSRSSRTRRHNSIPSTLGIIQSLMISETSCSFSRCNASAPSAAVITT